MDATPSYRPHDEWRGVPDYVIFDHAVHVYTPEEIASRLTPHIGRSAHFMQTSASHTCGCSGVIIQRGGRFILRYEPHDQVDLTERLTAVTDDTNKSLAYTMLKIDRSDRCDAIVAEERRLRERAGQN